MNAEIKTKWLVALRSGEYKQCKGRLRNYGRKQFCCLGVLADINGEKWTLDKYKDWGVGGCMNREESEYLGHGTGLRRPSAGKLMTMNDKGKSFLEIADYIEAKL